MKLRLTIVSITLCCLFVLCFPAVHANAGTNPFLLENAVSATLDLWRENRIEQLYERMAHRGATSKDQFVEKMSGTSIRPACCWQKMDAFKVLNDNGTEATVSAKIGLEITKSIDSGTSYSGTRDLTTVEYITREFKLNFEGGIWKMRLSDILTLRSYW